jgi:hypothetical protein
MNVKRISAWLRQPIKVEDISRWWSIKRPRVGWRDYLLAAALAYLLPLLALGIEWVLTWQHQLFMAGRLGLPLFGDATLWLWLAIPTSITFLIFLPFLRYPVRCRVAAVLVCAAWIVFLLSGEAGVK